MTGVHGLEHIKCFAGTVSPKKPVRLSAGEHDITLVLEKINEQPKKTQVLANYPNPFNPETWIPYQLSEESNLSIKIYTSAGRLVRTLDLGNKQAGFYVTKEKAAYWDGRNESGEQVVSGIYFYTIHAGEFAATRKMIVVR